MKLRVQHRAVQHLARRSHVGQSRAVLVAGLVAAPFLVGGYVVLTMIVVLPLLGLRWMFPYGSTPSMLAWYGQTGRYSGDARVSR